MKGPSAGDRIAQRERRIARIEAAIPEHIGPIGRIAVHGYIALVVDRGLTRRQLARVVWPWQQKPAKHTGGRGRVRGA